MNKNILLLGAAGLAYWFVRNQQSQAATTSSAGLTTGAVNYLPATTTPAATTSSGTNWLQTATGIATTAGGLIKTGTSIWGDISGALHLGSSTVDGAAQSMASAPTSADVTADSSAGIWAGPTYEQS